MFRITIAAVALLAMTACTGSKGPSNGAPPAKNEPMTQDPTTSELESLRLDLEAKAQLVTDLQKDNNALALRVGTLEQQLETRDAELTKVTGERDAARKQHQETLRDLDNQKQLLEDQKAFQQMQDAKLEKLQHEAANRESVDDLKDELQDAQAKIKQMRKQNAKLRKSLQAISEGTVPSTNGAATQPSDNN